MAGELHKVTVRFDADTAAFNTALQASGQRVKTFSNDAVASVNKQSAAERDLAHHHQRIIELERQWQAAQAKRNTIATLRKNSEVINGFQKLNTVTGAATRTMAGSTSAFRSLSSSLTTVAATVLPVNAGLLRVGSTLGLMTLSGGMMVGVLAGLSALSFAWDKLSKDAKALKQEIEGATKSINDMWLETQTQGDISFIERNTALARELDALYQNLEDAERRAAGPSSGIGVGAIAAQQEVLDLQEKIAEKEKVRERGEEQLATRRALRQKKEAEDRKREAADALKAGAAAEKDAAKRIGALATLVAASRATAAETAELRDAQARFRDVMRDGTADVHDRVEAMAELTRIQKAFTAAFLRDNARIGAGDMGRLRVAPAGTVRAKNQPTASEEWKLLEEQIRRSNPVVQQAASDVANAFGNAAHDIITHTNSIAGAVTNMIRSILSDLARLVIQRQIVGPIFNALMGSSSFGGAVGGVGGVTPNPVSAPSIGKLVAAGTNVTVNMAVPISVQALDSRTAHDVIMEQSGSVGESFVKALQGSSALQQIVRGRG